MENIAYRSINGLSQTVAISTTMQCHNVLLLKKLLLEHTALKGQLK